MYLCILKVAQLLHTGIRVLTVNMISRMSSIISHHLHHCHDRYHGIIAQSP
jgi:uncharacterized LabA/DUF88 family protein